MVFLKPIWVLDGHLDQVVTPTSPRVKWYKSLICVQGFDKRFTVKSFWRMNVEVLPLLRVDELRQIQPTFLDHAIFDDVRKTFHRANLNVSACELGCGS